MIEDEPSALRLQPILAIAHGDGVILKRGARLHAGGHFYPTDSSDFGSVGMPVPFVFINVEVDAIVGEDVPLANGTSIALARLDVLGRVPIPYASIHPMVYRCHPKSSASGYYLPAGQHVAQGDVLDAWKESSADPAMKVTIVSLGGSPGRLVDKLSLQTDGLEHKEKPLVEDDS